MRTLVIAGTAAANGRKEVSEAAFGRESKCQTRPPDQCRVNASEGRFRDERLVVARAAWGSTQALREATEAILVTPAEATRQLAALEDRAKTLATTIGRLTAAIGAGGELAPLVAELKAKDRERIKLEQEHRELERLTRADRLDVRRVERDLQDRVMEWRAAATRNVSQGRQVLRKLLAGRVTMTPRSDGTCEIFGRADYGKLFSGIVATALASPTGTARVCGPDFRRILKAA
jgi:hypothetical protein